jgi:hypothetical protein
MRSGRPRTKAKVRRVLLDDSFVNALLATDVAEHADACALYGQLVDNYENGLDRLFALSTVLGDVPREFRRNALAPVETVNVAAQHRTAARDVAAPISPRTALSMVMLRRERINAVATATHEFDPLAIEVLSVAARAENGFAEAVPDGYQAFEPSGFASPGGDPLNSGTAPLPAPRSTDE